MKKIIFLILLLFSSLVTASADDAHSDTLTFSISYGDLYAVNWNVSIYPVADIYSFPQDSVDYVVNAMLFPQKEYLFGGNNMICYYLDISFQEAQLIKSNIEKFNLPDGYKWGFSFYDNDIQRLGFSVAVYNVKSLFCITIGHAFFEKDSFGKPSIGFSFLQGENENSLQEYRNFQLQHNNNAFVIEINNWFFAPTQINQLYQPDNRYTTISFVPRYILENLYKPPFNQDTEEIVE